MLSLERFAAIRAAIERGGDRDRVLRGEEIDRAQWLELQRHWLDALASEVERGGDSLATRYCRAFGGASPTATAAEVPATEPEKRGEAAPVPRPPEPPVHTPSYLRVVPAVSQQGRAPSALARTLLAMRRVSHRRRRHRDMDEGASQRYGEPAHRWPQSHELTSPVRHVQQSLGIGTPGPSQLPTQHS